MKKEEFKKRDSMNKKVYEINKKIILMKVEMLKKQIKLPEENYYCPG